MSRLWETLPPELLKSLRANAAKTPKDTCPFCWASGLVDTIQIGDPYNYEHTFVCDCPAGNVRRSDPVYASLRRWTETLHARFAVKGHQEYMIALETNLKGNV